MMSASKMEEIAKGEFVMNRRKRNVLIWGTGGIATDAVRFGYFENANIVGFVDTYKKIQKCMGYPVYSPQEASQLEHDEIIVCVLKCNKEILETCRQNKIAEEKLFFLHSESKLGGVQEAAFVEKIKTVKERYPLVYKCMQNQVEQFLFINKDSSLNVNMQDRAYIRSEAGYYVVAWIPIELIFSEKRQDIAYVDSVTEEWEKQNSLYQDIPLIGFIPYRSLYNFFSQGSQFPWEYCEWFQYLFTSRGKQSGYTNESLVEKRYREYKIMHLELQKGGLDFFVKHPAIGKWNERGYINLTDGHHRTSFLYNMGFRYVPVQLTKEDYGKWCNYKQAEMVHQVILEQKRTEFYQPILNPYFMFLQSHREDVTKSRLQMIMEHFNNKRFDNTRVVDIGANLGYFGTHFARMGAKVDLVEFDPQHYELTQEVILLMQVKNTQVLACAFENLEIDEDYDYAILLTVFYHYMSNLEVRNQFINQLNQHVKTAVIWESGNNIEDERTYILDNTKFKKYVHLGYTYATGKFREIGVFYA